MVALANAQLEIHVWAREDDYGGRNWKRGGVKGTSVVRDGPPWHFEVVERFLR